MLLLLASLMPITAAAAPPDDEGDDDTYEENEERPQDELEGSSRFTLMTGWRYAPNDRFLDLYYSRPKYQGLERARGAIGGPLLVGSFAFSPINLIEVGIDLFSTYERMAFPGQPALHITSFGASAHVRFQHKFMLGRHGLIPSAGLLLGPMFVVSTPEGGKGTENGPQSFGVSAGATLCLSEVWGLRVEYRLVTGQGQAADIGPFDAGGSWFSVGLNYQFPLKPARPLRRLF